jgi:hypothetical protein
MSIFGNLRDLRWAINQKGDIATPAANIASDAAQIAGYEGMSQWYSRSRK